MRRVAIFLAGLILGLFAGYMLHGYLAGPLGSNFAERRILTADLDLKNKYFFAPQSPAPVTGTLLKGSEVLVEWHYSSAAYIAVRTVVGYDDLAAVSREVPRR